jgi:hypothetical protein
MKERIEGCLLLVESPLDWIRSPFEALGKASGNDLRTAGRSHVP